MEPSFRFDMAPAPDQQPPDAAHSTGRPPKHLYSTYSAALPPHQQQESYLASHSPGSWTLEDLAAARGAPEGRQWEQQPGATGNVSRASNACARCRELQITCELGPSFSEDQPACERCRAAQVHCIFDLSTQSDHHDTFKEEILARMTALEARMHRLESRISQLPISPPAPSTSAPPAVQSTSVSLGSRLAYFEAHLDGVGAPPYSHSEPPTPTSPFYPPQVATSTHHTPFPPSGYPSVLQPSAPPAVSSAPQHLTPYPQHQTWEHQNHLHPSTNPDSHPSTLPSPSHSSAMALEPAGAPDSASLPVVYRPLTEIERRLGQPYRYPTVYVEGVQGQQSRGSQGWGSRGQEGR